MKRLITGGFLAVIGSIWAVGILYYTATHLTLNYATPPGQFLWTLYETWLLVPCALSVFALISGLYMMLTECFGKVRTQSEV